MEEHKLLSDKQKQIFFLILSCWSSSLHQLLTVLLSNTCWMILY